MLVKIDFHKLLNKLNLHEKSYYFRVDMQYAWDLIEKASKEPTIDDYGEAKKYIVIDTDIIKKKYRYYGFRKCDMEKLLEFIKECEIGGG